MSTDRGEAASGTLRATYRLQLTPTFGFDEAAAVAPYLQALGVSHVYSSPYLQAAAGSTHGYDVVDPHRVNGELGGPVPHQRFCRVLGDHELGQVLDIVPNHMSIGGPDNPWWADVLENGPSSRYAHYFDVDWAAVDEHLQNKVLLPVLGDHYGRVLDAGELTLERDNGRFHVAYHEHRFPVAPPSLEQLLVRAGERAGSDELVFIGGSFGRLPSSLATDTASRVRRNRDKEVLKVQLSRLAHDHRAVAEALDAEVAALNADTDALDALLQRQNYRLAYWRLAREDLDYRRFFDVTSLIGLRTEDERVFADTHLLLLEWLRTGVLDGLRIDHPDGLRDPRAYFDRLRAASHRAWVVVEKILATEERMPADWPVDGTTGYDFLNRLNGLFVDPAGEGPLTEIYAEVTGNTTPFEEVAYDKKHLVLREVLASEVTRLTRLFADVVYGDRRHRDYQTRELRNVLREVVACFPVYRTYVRAEAGEVTPTDVEHVTRAIAETHRRRPELDADLLALLRDVLTLEVRGELESEFVMRFQQLTAPVMAKGVEDTAFYDYNRLISLNEVGGNPGRFGVSLEEWHAAAADTQARWPRAMLATSTHDTKRSEDVRARINLLSEVPWAWRDVVARWIGRNLGKRTRDLPDRNTEYFIYQTLVGAWPIDHERLWAYVQKAVREAKVHTSWTDPNAAYEEALEGFLTRCLGDPEFVADLEEFVAWLRPRAHASSLAQTLLKLTVPGVPDIYQGTEIWDLSLVDPDNRRPVDFDLRRRLLDRARTATADDVMADMDEGLPKIWLVHHVLETRRRAAPLFAPEATYEPLWATGWHADRVVAFKRGGQAIVAAPRLTMGVDSDWGGTSLELPVGCWEDQLTGALHDGGFVDVGRLFARFPGALLLQLPE